MQNDPNRAEFIIERERAYVRARVNARACIAIMLHSSQKSITIQLCLAQRKMIRTVETHLYFRLSFGAIISYDETASYYQKKFIVILIYG